MKKMRSLVLVAVLAAGMSEAVACEKGRHEAPAQNSTLSPAIEQIRAEARAGIARNARAALVALRSEAASAVAVGAGTGEGSTKAGP